MGRHITEQHYLDYRVSFSAYTDYRYNLDRV